MSRVTVTARSKVTTTQGEGSKVTTAQGEKCEHLRQPGTEVIKPPFPKLVLSVITAG